MLRAFYRKMSTVLPRFKLLALISLTLFASLLSFNKVSASNQIDLHLFYGQGCPHCANEKSFLETVKPKYPNLKVNLYEVYYDDDNLSLMQEVAKKLAVSTSGVPFTVMGDSVIVGFNQVELEEKIEYCSNKVCENVVGQIIDKFVKSKVPEEKKDDKKTETEKPKDDKKDDEVSKTKFIDLPVLGRVDAMKFSLPIITIIIGLVDGFNPCAMWALIFLISLLISIGDRRRMWILGSIFILTSGFVYFLLMAAWLNVVLLLGLILWVRLLVGFVAVGGGGYNLFKFIKNRKETGCPITASSKRQVTFDKIRQLSQSQRLLMAIVGIVLLAFSVNLVELICSAGLPVVYTQILTMSNLSGWQYYAYIILYIFFFMLDDLVVFIVAMVTLKITGASTKYGKLCSLVGGILMIIIGLLLVFKPEYLMLG